MGAAYAAKILFTQAEDASVSTGASVLHVAACKMKSDSKKSKFVRWQRHLSSCLLEWGEDLCPCSGSFW
jgi:hypothetical protein